MSKSSASQLQKNKENLQSNTSSVTAPKKDDAQDLKLQLIADKYPDIKKIIEKIKADFTKPIKALENLVKIYDADLIQSFLHLDLTVASVALKYPDNFIAIKNADLIETLLRLDWFTQSDAIKYCNNFVAIKGADLIEMMMKQNWLIQGEIIASPNTFITKYQTLSEHTGLADDTLACDDCSNALASEGAEDVNHAKAIGFFQECFPY